MKTDNHTYFDDIDLWESSTDENGNYIPPKLGNEEEFQVKTNMPESLRKLINEQKQNTIS